MSEHVSAAADREFVALVDRWVDRMHDASQNIVGTSADAATICREVLESLWERRDDLTDADLTREALLLATRQRSLEHLAAHGWQPPGSVAVHTTDAVDDAALANGPRDSAVIRYRVVLAHAAAAVLGAGNTSLIDLHVRHSVDADALCDALGVDSAAAPVRLAKLHTRLGEAMAAFTLWNDGRPVCAELNAQLIDTDVFDRAVFDTIGRHRETCTRCDEERRSLVYPAGLFLTARVATVAPAVRQNILEFAAPGVTDRPATTASSNLAVISADDIEAARRPGENDDIAELWASAASTAPAPRSTPVASHRRRARPSTATILVGGAAFLVVVASGAVLAVRAADGDDRVVIETPLDGEQPERGSEEEPEVRSLGPLPPTTGATTGPDTTEPDATGPDNTEPDTTEPDTTEPDTTEAVPGELPDRSELSVVAANGANVAGAAGAAAARLQQIGYVDVLALNGTDIFEFTTVYYAEGFEEAALRMAEDLNLLPDFVAPIEDAPGVADLPADTELLPYIGRDRA